MEEKKKLVAHKPNRSFRNEKHSFNKSSIKMAETEQQSNAQLKRDI